MALAERTLGAGTDVASTDGATTLSISPTGMQEGDWLEFGVCSAGGTGAHTNTAGGLTRVHDDLAGGTTIVTSTWKKKCGASEAGPYTFSFGGSTRRATINVTCWSGGDSTDIVESAPTQVTAATTTSINAPGVDPAATGGVHIIHIFSRTAGGVAQTFNSVTNYTQQNTKSSTHATNANANGSTYSRALPDANATGDITCTVGTADRLNAASILLKPATTVSGTIAATLPALTGDTNGTVTVNGPIAATLPALTSDVAGAVTVDGPIAATLPVFTAALDGTVADDTVSGSIAAVLPALSAALDGTVTVGGSIAATLPVLVTSLIGEVPSVGPVTAILPALTASLTGTAETEPDLEITILAARDDGWLPATDETLVAEYLTTGDQRVWRLNLDADGGGDPALAGRPMLIWSTDGTLASNVTAYATDRAPVDPYGRVHLRVHLDVNNGSGGWTVTFEYLDGNGEWQLVGEPVTGDPPTLLNPASTAELTVGAYIGDSGALNRWTGRIYSLQVRVGRTGEILASPDFTNHPAGTETFTDAQGNVWDVHAPASLTSSQSMTTVAILGPLATDECATWVDFTLPRSGVGRTCDHEPDECCSYYRARTIGQVDGLLQISDWSADSGPDEFCLQWSDDEHLIRTSGPSGPMYAVVWGKFDWNVERPFTAATGVMGSRFVTSAPPGGRNLNMVAAVENEVELATLRAVLARPLVLISPSDASEVWAAPVQETVRIVKVGRIRQVTASFVGTGPEPPPQTADVGV